MKMKSLFLAVLLVVASVASFAGKDEPRRTGLAVVPVKGSEIFKVIYQGESAGKVKLNIYDNTGAVVYTETIAGLAGFICPVNFRGLASGDYTIEVVDASGKKIEKVWYAPVKESGSFHVVRLNDGKFLLSISGKTNDIVTVKIYDNDDNLLYKEAKEINGDFAQVYKISTASKGFTFELTDKSGNTKRLFF